MFQQRVMSLKYSADLSVRDNVTMSDRCDLRHLKNVTNKPNFFLPKERKVEERLSHVAPKATPKMTNRLVKGCCEKSPWRHLFFPYCPSQILQTGQCDFNVGVVWLMNNEISSQGELLANGRNVG